MDKAEQLRRAGAQILIDVEAWYERAFDDLDDLDAWGKNPTLTGSLLSELVPREPYCYTTPAKLLESPPPLPRLPREAGVRSPAVEAADASVDVSEILNLAHAEDPQAWQVAISRAIDEQVVPFSQLLSDTGLSPGELLLGLLLGEWQLSQREFYGELLCSRK